VIGNLVFWAGAFVNFTASACYIARRYGRELPAWANENLLWTIGFGTWCAQNIAGHNYWLALAYGVVAALDAWVWWHDRRNRKRKRAARQLGYKARALVAALVQRAREAAQPRPVLQPQRQAS
jgi:hypothetical protein